MCDLDVCKQLHVSSSLSSTTLTRKCSHVKHKAKLKTQNDKNKQFHEQNYKHYKEKKSDSISVVFLFIEEFAEIVNVKFQIVTQFSFWWNKEKIEIKKEM